MLASNPKPSDAAARSTVTPASGGEDDSMPAAHEQPYHQALDSRALRIRKDCGREDVMIDERMRVWTEVQLRRYFQSGGAWRPPYQ